MTYLSVFSGIEAASVAWKDLGWEAKGFAEIDEFASAVLAHHFPSIKNYGDITKHTTWDIAPGSIDILIGGSPCQSFSASGKRTGLADPRGQLSLTYLELVKRLQPRWIVWENVPNVLRSNQGRDFAHFIISLGQCGYGWTYRVLDIGESHSKEEGCGLSHILQIPAEASGHYLSSKAILGINKRIGRGQYPLLYRQAAGTIAGQTASLSLIKDVDCEG
jgi:hypothetical protein